MLICYIVLCNKLVSSVACYVFLLACMAYMLLLFIQFGVDTVPVLIGPVSYLLLSKPAKGVEKGFPLLSLLSSILPVYK